jgi:hypothetical protein
MSVSFARCFPTHIISLWMDIGCGRNVLCNNNRQHDSPRWAQTECIMFSSYW